MLSRCGTRAYRYRAYLFQSILYQLEVRAEKVVQLTVQPNGPLGSTASFRIQDRFDCLLPQLLERDAELVLTFDAVRDLCSLRVLDRSIHVHDPVEEVQVVVMVQRHFRDRLARSRVVPVVDQLLFFSQEARRAVCS